MIIFISLLCAHEFRFCLLKVEANVEVNIRNGIRLENYLTQQIVIYHGWVKVSTINLIILEALYDVLKMAKSNKLMTGITLAFLPLCRY